MTDFNTMQLIKRRFFAMRNGVIADTLRRNGSPFKIIFGLNLPQIDDIARDLGKNHQLGETLWANSTTRESMILAPMLMDVNSLSFDDIAAMTAESPAPEITDTLVHKLLRHHPDSLNLAKHLARADKAMTRYAAMRMLWHHVYTSQAPEVKALAEIELEKNEPLTAGPARQIVNEINEMNQ
ncbi:MAG: DNA alkylation repair protein [Barnesiella sp.]|nr:DNA alkylation repair protein [Barnesiella sp.]